MKKKLLALFSCAIIAAMAMCLAGCSASLDKDLTVLDLTVKVPSSWSETFDDTSSDAFGKSGTYYYENNDRTSGIVVSYDEVNQYNNRTPKEEMEISKETALSDPVNGYDYYENAISQRVIDNGSITRYDYGYKYKDTDGNEYEANFHEAFIQKVDSHYRISVWGDDFSIDEVVDTVTLA